MVDNNGVYVPKMPWFEPSSEPTAKASLLSQTVSESDRFTFPADRDFWSNFLTQVQQYPGATDPPHYHVDASHTDESVLVNREFLRRFVSGWERANPHVVVVSTPTGTATFHSSEEFWHRFVTLAGERSRARAARGELGTEDTTVKSELLPNNAPIRTTQKDWQEICQSWEQDCKLGSRKSQPPPSLVATPPAYSSPQLQQPPQSLQPQMFQPAPPSPETPALTAQLEVQRRQIEELRQQLSQVTQQSAMGASAVQDELRRAQAEAGRYHQEAEMLRSEKDTMEGRVRNLEQMLSGLQGDVQRQRHESQKELAEARQAADVADLKKELQMRELMQEELFKAREEATKEAENRCKVEMSVRTQQEVASMRRALFERDSNNNSASKAPPCRRCGCYSTPSTPRTLLPRRQTSQVILCGQRTVATQTPPPTMLSGPVYPSLPPAQDFQYLPSMAPICDQPACSPPRRVAVDAERYTPTPRYHPPPGSLRGRPPPYVQDRAGWW